MTVLITKVLPKKRNASTKSAKFTTNIVVEALIPVAYLSKSAAPAKPPVTILLGIIKPVSPIV